MARRDAGEVLRLLEHTDAAEIPAEARARAWMTEGFARCYLAALADDPAGGEAGTNRGRAVALLRQADSLATELRSPELSAEVALRQGTCLTYEKDAPGAEARLQAAFETAGRQRLQYLQAHAAGALGFLRLRNSRYDDAADWFERSRAFTAGLEADSVEVKLITNLGWCYTMLGDTDKAVPLLRQAETMARSLGYAEELKVALAHLGSNYLKLGRLGEARQCFEEGREIARGQSRVEEQAEFLSYLQSVALQGRDQHAARTYALEAAALRPAELARAPVPSLTEALLEVERGGHATAERMYEQIIHSQPDPDVAWQAQAGLARLYVATGRASDARRAFRETGTAIEHMPAQRKEDNFEFLLLSSLNEFYGRYATFLVDQGEANEALRVVEGSRGRVLWERSRGESEPMQHPQRYEPVARACGAVLLSYWIGERSFLWVVTGERTEVHELGLPASELRGRIERYQSVLLRSRDPLDVAPQEGVELYRILVGPAAAAIPKGGRVIVVADGPLHQFSFDTLIAPSPRPHYWLEDVVGLRTPSLGLLAARRPSGERPSSDLLLVGDPIQPSEGFPDLPNAAREIASIGQHFRATSVVLAGSRATPSAFRQADPSRFRLIHFAAHNKSNRERPLESAVVLSRDPAGYKLYARDVLDLHIRAELVTLSACEAAGSRAYRGEGLVGFAWAFLRAGARHVIASLWNVEDASTARLMDHLYQGLARGLAPPEALHEARLDLLRSQEAYRKPFYWGPFVVYAQQQAGRSPRPRTP